MNAPLTGVSFVPRLFARRLSELGSSPLSPREERIEAAVLVTDISGFTAFTERLAQRGPAGAEVVRGVVNQCFSELIDLVVLYKGDVATLAGDAVIAFWPTSRDCTLDAAVHASSLCALAIRAALKRWAEQGATPLQLRIGVGAGPLWTGVLGGIGNRWEFLVGGGALQEASFAVARAEPAQILLTADAWRRVAAMSDGASQSDRLVELRAVHADAAARQTGPPDEWHVPENILHAFVPKAVVAAMEGSRLASIAEFRHVTVLFAFIDGLDYAADDVMARCQTVLTTAQRIIARLEGSLNRFTVDDKGTVLIAAWGVRASAHEDNAARAIEAATLIHAGLSRDGLRCAVGVTSGRVFCADQGNTHRREFTMIGDVVNLASRLTEIGGVVCDQVTARAVGTRFRTEGLPPLVVKGKSEPIRPYRLAGDAKLPPEVAGFVGRESERRRLLEHLDALRSGTHARVIVAEGEAGVGKSFFLRFVVAEARARGIRVASGVANVAEQSTPYFVWRAVLRALLDADRLSATDLRQVVLDALGKAWAEWGPLLNALLPLELPDSPQTSQVTGRGRAQLISGLVVRLLEVYATDGLLITLDDAHWFDSPTWDVIAAVRRVSAPVAILVCGRPSLGSDGPGYGPLVEAGIDTMSLDRLPDDDVFTLLRQRVGSRRLGPRVEAFFRERSQGNPFFAEELLFDLQDRQALAADADICQFAPNIDLPSLVEQVPHRVHGVVAARIDRLDFRHQLALKAASVIGQSFTARLLADVHPDQPSPDQLQSCLEELERRRIILPVETASETYAFRHAITKDVAYDQLPFDDRRRLNRSVARWYEREYASNLAPYVPLLAHHWTEAASPQLARAAGSSAHHADDSNEDGTKAVTYLEAAAEQALAVYANDTAIHCLERVIELDDLLHLGMDRAKRARWEWRLGHANLQCSRNRPSQQHLENSLALLGRPVPVRQVHVTANIVAEGVRQLCHRLWPSLPRRGHTQEARRQYECAGDVYHELSEIAYFDNNLPRLLFTTVQTLNLADQTGVDGQTARACATAAVAAGTAQLHRVARFYSRRSLDAARRTDDLAARAFSQLACGVYFSGVGAWQQLDEVLSDSARVFATVGNRYRYELTLAQRAFTFLHRGRFANAREMLDEVYESAEPLQTRLLSLSGLLIADLAQGTVVPQRVRSLTTLLAANTQRSEQMLGYGLLALAHVRDGSAAAARDAAARVPPATGAIPPGFYSLRGIAGLCETRLRIYSGAWTPSGAMREIRELVRFSRFFPIGAPSASLWTGCCLELCGRHRRAAVMWTRALNAAEQLAMPYDAALAYLARGQSPRRSLTARREDLERAEHVFSSLGAAYGAGLARQVSRAL